MNVACRCEGTPAKAKTIFTKPSSAPEQRATADTTEKPRARGQSAVGTASAPIGECGRAHSPMLFSFNVATPLGPGSQTLPVPLSLCLCLMGITEVIGKVNYFYHTFYFFSYSLHTRRDEKTAE